MYRDYFSREFFWTDRRSQKFKSALGAGENILVRRKRKLFILTIAAINPAPATFSAGSKIPVRSILVLIFYSAPAPPVSSGTLLKPFSTLL